MCTHEKSREIPRVYLWECDVKSCIYFFSFNFSHFAASLSIGVCDYGNDDIESSMNSTHAHFSLACRFVVLSMCGYQVNSDCQVQNFNGIFIARSFDIIWHGISIYYAGILCLEFGWIFGNTKAFYPIAVFTVFQSFFWLNRRFSSVRQSKNIDLNGNIKRIARCKWSWTLNDWNR